MKIKINKEHKIDSGTYHTKDGRVMCVFSGLEYVRPQQEEASLIPSQRTGIYNEDGEFEENGFESVEWLEDNILKRWVL
jgi:hypothetical protein